MKLNWKMEIEKTINPCGEISLNDYHVCTVAPPTPLSDKELDDHHKIMQRYYQDLEGLGIRTEPMSDTNKNRILERRTIAVFL